MKWRGARGSAHIRDRRLSPGRAAGGGGLIAIIVVIASVLFPDVVPLLNALGLSPGAQLERSDGEGVDDEIRGFISATLGYTEDVWGEAFAAGAFPAAGRTYRPATLVLYSEATSSACGDASSSFGPFYCPADGSIYIDPSFYTVMARDLNAPGDFAQAYVIAHEVAHHVQNLNGLLPDVLRRRQSVGELEGNRLTVRLELQADCYSGYWARAIQDRRGVLEAGDLEEALRAAYQVGDDVIARMSGQPVDADNFTHGSAQQRMSWFRRGFEGGSPADCDTFSQAYDRL